MFKIFLILIIFISLNVYAQEEVIKLSAKYNEANARIEIFKDLKKKLDKDFYSKYKKDLYKDENKSSIEKKLFKIKNRELCPFYIKNTLISYAIIYDETPNYAFYYNILGNLIKIDILQENTYPKKILGYSRYGNLISATLEADENEQFVYDENGKLIAHWVGDEMLNKNIKTPKVFKLRRE